MERNSGRRGFTSGSAILALALSACNEASDLAGGPAREPTLSAETLFSQVPNCNGGFARCTEAARVVRRFRRLGRQVVTAKIENLDTREVVTTHIDERGAEITPEELRSIEAAESRLHDEICGRLQDGYCETTLHGDPDEKARTAIWISAPQPPPHVKHMDTDDAASQLDAYRRPLRDLLRKARERLEKQHALTVMVPDQDIPLLLAEGTVAATVGAAFDTDLPAASIQPAPGGGTPYTSLDWWKDIGADAADSAGWDGGGVKVAVFERDRPDTTATVCSSTTRLPSGLNSYWHPRGVGGIICEASGSGGNPGVASSATLAFANTDDTGGFDHAAMANALSWSRTQGANVVNQSFGFEYNTAWCQQGWVNRYEDYYAIMSPYQTFVTAVGNNGNQLIDPTDPTKGYFCIDNGLFNGLTVGGVDYKSTPSPADDTAAPTSNWENYHVYFNSIAGESWGKDYGDWELPHIAAPSTPGMKAGGLDGLNGTSFAAPAVAGTAAAIMERLPDIKTWPEAVRAVILASANRVVGANAWNPAFCWSSLHGTACDDRVGVGLLSTSGAVSLADPAFRIASIASETCTASPPSKGLRYGSLALATSTTFGLRTFWFRASATGRVSIALTWDATPSCPDQMNCGDPLLDADLDLWVGQCTSCTVCSTKAASRSVSNSVEYVEFSVATGQLYRIDIDQQGARNRPSTYAALAWYNRL